MGVYIDMNTLRNMRLHLIKVATHRKWVMFFCFKIGLYKRGLLHDLSKYSPTEFLESAKYYQGHRSPIDACKEKNGYSMAWFHHRGRNKHHWEFWVDGLQEGMKPVLMPYEFAAEMVCDFLGAGRAYMGKSYSFEKEYKWWQKKREVVVMHPSIILFVDRCFANILLYGESWFTRDNVVCTYINAILTTAHCS